MLFTLIFLIPTFFSDVLGQESKQAHEAYTKQMADQLEDFQKLAKNLDFLIEKLPSTGKGCKHCGSEVQNLEPIKNDDKNGILVFVSFSMPKSSLIELNDQAQNYKARLILRGIYQNSFSKTKEKILEIEPKGLTMDIDPQLFKQFKIERVPTFVLLKDGKEVNRLVGNVTLEFAHQKLNGESK